MIDIKSLILDSGGLCAPLCAHDTSSADLAADVAVAIEAHAPQISVAADAVGVVWPWIEEHDIKIMARFAVPDGDTWDVRISEFAMRVNAAFKSGAAGAQIFVRGGDIAAFCDALRPIRDDLFFNRELCIALDMSDVNSMEWENIFRMLARVRADSVLFTLAHGAGGKSDYVGWLYGMLSAMNESVWDGALRFAVGNNPTRIEQAQRLTGAMRANKLEEMIIFVNN